MQVQGIRTCHDRAFRVQGAFLYATSSSCCIQGRLPRRLSILCGKPLWLEHNWVAFVAVDKIKVPLCEPDNRFSNGVRALCSASFKVAAPYRKLRANKNHWNIFYLGSEGRTAHSYITLGTAYIPFQIIRQRRCLWLSRVALGLILDFLWASLSASFPRRSNNLSLRLPTGSALFHRKFELLYLGLSRLCSVTADPYEAITTYISSV